MGNLGFGELLILLAVILLIFGSSKLPQLGDALGRAVRNVRRGLAGAGGEPPAKLPPGDGQR
jgi:TatA/E family protein of Tat protein translocase